MAAYNYKASTLDGRIIEGVMEASDDRTVLHKLQDMGYLPIRVGVEGKESFLRKEIGLPWAGKKVRHKDILIFTQELATLLKAGLPLDRSLFILSDLAEKAAMAQVIGAILKDIKGGKALAEALSAHPHVFPKLYVNMIKAGEVGGVLDQILERLVEYYEAGEELRSYFVSALIYPILLAVVGTISILVLLLFVIPEFSKIFVDAGAPLPAPMQVLVGISDLLKGYGWVLVTLGVGGLFALRRFLATEEGRYKWDQRMLKMPVWGNLVRKIEVARFARTLGTLLKSAVPLLQALTVVREIVSNRVIASTLDSLRTGIKKGEGISYPIKQSGAFPAFAVHLLEVGEESGKLDEMLLRVADSYDREIRTVVKSLISFFEPAMILLMGVVVGAMVISMLMSIFSIQDIPLR